MCQFPLLAAELSAAGVSSFRFDHPCAIFSKSERRGPFLMGNHEEEVQDMRDAVDFLQGTLGKRVVCLLGHRCGRCGAWQQAHPADVHAPLPFCDIGLRQLPLPDRDSAFLVSRLVQQGRDQCPHVCQPAPRRAQGSQPGGPL